MVEYEKTQYIWTLYKYLGEKEDLMVGEMIMPVDHLDEEMTSQDLLLELNSQNLFDFDFSSSEGHNLQIRKEFIYKSVKSKPRPELYDYMSFIYRNGSWKEEVHDVFSDRIQRFKTGKIIGS